MATEHYLYIDTPVSHQALRDTLAAANIGLEVEPDWYDTNGMMSAVTNVILFTLQDDLHVQAVRPDNGVIATCSVTFRDLRWSLHNQNQVEPEPDFETQTVLGIQVLLRAYPEADAYWEAYDGRVPILLRRAGRLVLSQGEFWDPGRSTMLDLVTLPYVIEPLGPWAEILVRPLR